MDDAKSAARDEIVYDVTVVGGGPAGLNAALVLGRARRRVAVVDAGEPRNAPAARMGGLLSRDGTAPAALLEAGRAEVTGYGGQVIDGRVNQVDRTGPAFLTRLAGGRALRSRRVLVATGLRDELPGIPGVRELWGRDVLHCPYCHGHEVADEPVGVLGTRGEAVHQALLLRQWTRDVVLFPHTLKITGREREQLAARGVRVVAGEVGRLVTGDGRLRGVELAGGRLIPRAAVFVAPRAVPCDAVLTALGCERDDTGWVRVDASGRTSVPGVWAAGNVADPWAQVVTAAARGATAAIAVNRDLVEEEVTRAVRDHRAASRTPGR